MSRPVVHESWGPPRRIAHNYEVHEVTLWKAGVLLWVIITSIIGTTWIVKALWDLL